MPGPGVPRSRGWTSGVTGNVVGGWEGVATLAWPSGVGARGGANRLFHHPLINSGSDQVGENQFPL